MFDLILIALALLIILASPHPLIGLVNAVILMVTVPFRCWMGVEQAKMKRWKKGRK